LATDGAHFSQYDANRTRALLSEAGRLIRGVGFSGIHLTFIGGLVPSLLVPNLDPGIDPHVGSGDIDLCLSVALATGQVGAYQRIEKALAELGYKMKPLGPSSASSWQWIGGEKHKVTVEFFCAPVASNEVGTLYRPEGDVTKGLSAMTLGTGELIDRDRVELSLQIELPDGSIATLPFRVTAPASFLASKADALVGRDKNKDAYDVVWLCEAWPGGQDSLARVVQGSPVFNDPLMRHALEILTSQFDGIDSLGSRAYARFIEPQGVADFDASARRASGAVKALIRLL
jgi:hypothetical protein